MSDGGHPGPWDAGLQPERTSLAWMRTCLGLGGGGLLTARVFVKTDAWAAIGLVVLVVAVGAGLVWQGAQRRARTADASLRSGRGLAAGPGGRLLLVTTICAFVVAVANGLLLLADLRH
jgi:uncharacterized membrane protein YidH (DUF202 family)